MSIPAAKTQKMLFTLLAVALAVLAFVPLTAWADEVDDLLSAGEYIEGQAVVGFLSEGENLTAQSSLPYAIESLTDVNMSSVQPQVSSSELVLNAQASQRVDIVLVSSDELTTEELLRALADDPRVVFAEPNYVNSLAWEEGDVGEPPVPVPVEISVDADSEREPQGESDVQVEQESDVQLEQEPNLDSDPTPEPEESDPLELKILESETSEPAADDSADPELVLTAAAPTNGSVGDLTPLVWGNWTTDQTTRSGASTANPSINVPSYGSDQVGANMDKQIVVALLDTAVDYTNPDLEDVLYRFTPEEQDALGCWEWGYTAIHQGKNGDVADQSSIDMGHGTHTAGTIGASWDGHGISGVASNVKIVSVALADGDGNENLADAICGFDFVRRFNEQAPDEQRIRITSNSWSEYMSSRALDAVIRELGDTWNIVSFFSSGNDGKNNDYYEKTPSSMANNPYAVIVANTTPAERLCSSSEYGEATVDLGAPGTNILSTICASQAHYFPDGSRETNLVYAGFDGDDDIAVTVSQLDADDAAHELPTEVVSDVHFFGTSCLSFDIDPAYVVGRRAWLDASEEYKIRLDFPLSEEAAQQFEGAENLHLGVGLSFEEGTAGFAAEVTTNATTKTVEDYVNSADDDCWAANDFVLTHDMEGDEAASRPAGDILSVTLGFCMLPGRTTVYLDSLGVGAQVLPYAFATGTSMSTPQVAGAAAVLASQGYEGKELASLVRSKVRIPDGGALPLKTGGIFDFNVAGSPDSDEEEAVAPVIADVSVSGTTVTITGENFGTAPGGVVLGRYVAGAEPVDVGATIASWGDSEVTLTLDDAFEGILSAVLTNPGGKYDTRYTFVSKSVEVYEQDLPLDTSTGDPFAYEEQGDWETKGPLVGLGCKLYYLPAYEGHRDEPAAHQRMLCFDLKTKTWSQLSDLPEWLQGVSAVMHEGKIVVEGATMYEEDGVLHDEFPEGISAEERVYVYDPATNAWSEASSEGMSLGQTIINDEGQLKLAGGDKPDPNNEWFKLPLPMMAYDLSAGAGEELCELPVAQKDPQAAAKDGTILLYDAARPTLLRVQDGQATELEGALPDFFLAQEGEPVIGAWGIKGSYAKRAILSPIADGFVLVGPPSVGGVSDTFVLHDGADAFEPYEKRSSDDRVYAQAACTYRGRLFVIGSAWFEPDQRFFRATAMDVPEYPGDVPCDEDPEPTPEPEPTPTPKPAPNPTPNRVLPKTDDPQSAGAVAMLSVSGLALLSLGVTLATKRE